MLKLSEALEWWLGALDAPQESSDRRTLFLGAGFTKSCWSGAPQFADFVPELRARLAKDGGLEPWLKDLIGLERVGAAEAESRRAGGKPAIPTDASEIVELFDHRLGRVALVRGILAEPVRDELRMFPPVDQVRRPLPSRAESAFRTLRDWCNVLDAYHPTHLAPLAPDGPAVLLGRLIAEGVIDTIISTNWDAYVELGCLLAGMRICDGDENHHVRPEWLRALPKRLWVYETPEEAALRPRPQNSALLLKLHGGVRTLCGILRRLDGGEIPWPEAEARIRRSLRVSTEDLVHWQESARWVTEAAGDGLRSHNVLTLGVSGSDPVIYRAFRERLREWERAREGAARPERETNPPLVGVDLHPKLRLVNMLTVDRRRPAAGSHGLGTPRHQIAQAGGAEALRGAYAGWLLHLMATALEQAPGNSALDLQIRSVLLATWAMEVDRHATANRQEGTEGEQFPLLSLLCRSLGPAARFPAIAEGRPPFGATHPSVFLSPWQRWWYSPWGRSSAADVMREMATFAAVVACPTEGSGAAAIEIDPWTGVIFLPASHPLAVLLTGDQALNLLTLAWPWQLEREVRIERLRRELQARFGWGPGRLFSHLARARLHLVLFPGRVATSLVRQGRFSVAGVRATVLDQGTASTTSLGLWGSIAQKLL